MIFQLYLQMKAGKRPRVFKFGEQKRDFVYVKDVVKLTISALNAAKNGVYNCGSGTAFSFNQIVQELNQNLGLQLEPEYFENPYSFYQPHTEADLTLAGRDLKFVPDYPPANGIADYVAFLERNSTT
jgi:ADP-L-glycero-D-manno-heptose 6-epimerase